MTDETLDRDLRFAIANRRLLQLTYNSQLRIVEPHDYGRRRGGLRLLAYQLRGASTRSTPEWRDFDVAKIEAWTVLDEAFAGSRGGAHQRHKDWDEVFARVT